MEFDFSSAKESTPPSEISALVLRIDAIDIYSYYLEYRPSLKKMYLSPFKKETNESFNIYLSGSGVLLFKCFATGNSGSVINFVEILFDLSKEEAMKKIYNDMIVESKEGKNSSYIKNKLYSSPSEIKDSTPVKISIKSKNFTKSDLNYWGLFNISEEILNEYNVKACKYVWIEDKLVFSYSPKQPIYRFKIGNRVKIYRPFSPVKGKWRSNTSSNHIQGYNQLPKKGNILVITKALKDVMSFNSLNIPAVAPQSENQLLSGELMGEFLKRFKKIVVFYDNDKSGIEAAKAMHEEYALPYTFLMSSYEAKDPSDFIKKHGIRNAFILKDLIKYPIINV